eukprot:12465499-Heterocapsa_arctica.AAC.1
MNTQSVVLEANLCRGTRVSGRSDLIAAPNGMKSPAKSWPFRLWYGDDVAPGFPTMFEALA